MMTFRIEAAVHDGLAEAPPIEVEASSDDELIEWLREELPQHVGSTLLVTRIA